MKSFLKPLDLLITTGKILTDRTITFSRRILLISNYFISLMDGVIVYYDYPQRSKIFKLIKKIKKEVKMLMEINEAYDIFMITKNTSKIEGAIAEVGVYQGGSAKIICEAKGSRELHLFDTFSGLPKLTVEDQPEYFHEGEFLASLENVKSYLKKYRKVYFYKGLFPATGKSVSNKKFSFVNIDVDLYEATLSSLKFFYPKMSKGGIIVSHDYANAIGVKKAVDEFFKNKQEVVIELSGSQCMIVKM